MGKTGSTSCIAGNFGSFDDPSCFGITFCKSISDIRYQSLICDILGSQSCAAEDLNIGGRGAVVGSKTIHRNVTHSSINDTASHLRRPETSKFSSSYSVFSMNQQRMN
jgi:hypothetical protein